MCGIAGFWDSSKRWSGLGEARRRAESAQLSIAHRGPDAHGVWFNADESVCLVHRRLAIIDLNSRSTQPMISRSHQSVLSYNGEIYNFLDLQTELPRLSWRTTSDTEVALELLEAKGSNAVRLFDGMFALAHYDEQCQELLLAVDPFGKKPLYTFWDGQIFAFASEIKAFASMGLSLEVEREPLAEYFLFGSPLGSATVFKNVRRLEGGHWQKVVRGKPQTPSVYWDLPLGQIDKTVSYPDAQEQTRALIRKAVIKRGVSDVPVGCFLSGGLDSSIVALEAQRTWGSTLKTFSVGFGEWPAYDETSYAQKVAGKIGSHHTTLDGTLPSRNEITQTLSHFGEPFPDSSCLPTSILCKAVSKEVKVAVSGDGGDEIFGGYRRMQAALVTERWGGLMSIALSPLKIGGLRSASPRSKLGFLIRFQSALGYPFARRLLEWNSYFTEESLRKYLEIRWEAIESRLERWDERLDGHEAGQKILYLNAKTYLFSDLLPKVDRMSMAHGLEVRSPFLDKELAEFAFRLPVGFKFSGRNTKIILKDAYRQSLGAEIVDRRKQGFATPLAKSIQDWDQHESKSLQRLTTLRLNDLLDSQRSTSRFEACAFSMWSAQANLETARWPSAR